MSALTPLCPFFPTSLDYVRVEADISKLWSRWDVNGDGQITFDEFEHSVFPYIMQHYPRGAVATPLPPSVFAAHSAALEVHGEGGASDPDPETAEMLREIAEIDRVHAAQAPARTRGEEEVPSIQQPRQWFQYWDEDGSGHLDKVRRGDLIEYCSACPACPWPRPPPTGI